MQQPCPHCDQLGLTLLRLMLIGELLHIDETLLLLLADVMQQSGLRQLPDTAEEPAPVQGAPRTGTLHVLRQSGEVTISCHYPNHEEPS